MVQAWTRKFLPKYQVYADLDEELEVYGITCRQNSSGLNPFVFQVNI